MVARLLCIARGCAVTTAMKLRCRPGGGTGGGLAWPLGHEPDADQRVDAQAQACRAAARGRSAGHCRGDGTSKSAASRRFVALSAERLAEWMASDLSKLDLLVIQIDGLHIGNDLVLVAALGIDGEGHKHPLALIEGATENAAVVQAPSTI